MTSERPVDSEAAFNRALGRLPAHNYDVHSPTTSFGPSSKASAW